MPSRKLTARPWQWMVGTTFLRGMAYFQWRTVSFLGRVSSCLCDFFCLVWGNVSPWWFGGHLLILSDEACAAFRWREQLEDDLQILSPKKIRAIWLVGSQQNSPQNHFFGFSTGLPGFCQTYFFRGHVTLFQKKIVKKKRRHISDIVLGVCQDNVTGTAGSVLFAYDHDSDCIIPGCEWRSIYRADVRSSSWECLGGFGKSPWSSRDFSRFGELYWITFNDYDLARWTFESVWKF